ncbi:MAG: TonB family protein [Deltaproteobacteria bacterium]|nr:TonB family protein [Deltaproteobacteria bacterium]
MSVRRSPRLKRMKSIAGISILMIFLLTCVFGPACQPTTDDVDPTATVDKPKPVYQHKSAAKSKLTEEDRQRFIQRAMASIPAAKEDKTLSPYFFVLSDDPAVDRLPLKSTSADVHIAGVIAEVRVTQVYQNKGDNVLEAIYIFPVSTRAAVYAMKMTVGERVIEAQIKKREQARKDYEQARRQGRTASLLEQQRPNVFQMNVANIMPGDEIKVEMKYTELLVPEDRVYEFVYPTVVGPRYSETAEAGAADKETWVKNPHLQEGQESLFTFGLEVSISSGIPIAQVTCKSHDIKTDFSSEKTALISLEESKDAGNRDFILRYSLAGKKIQSGLLLYPGKKENFFLLMMEPPDRIQANDIVPREYIFIVDVSGSMNGFPLTISKELMGDLLSNLRKSDHFNVMLFASSSVVLSKVSLPATRANIKKGLAFVGRQRGGGGTRLLAAMKRALALEHTTGTSRIMVVITDGYVSVEKETFELIRNSLGEANLFAFGIGSSVNRFLIEGMARAGMGEPFVLTKPDAARQQAVKFREYISSPLLQGISVEFDDFDAYDVEPKAVPDLFAERPVIVFGKYRGDPEGAILVNGHLPGERLAGRHNLEDAIVSKDNAALRYLWARHRIMRLSDMNKLTGKDEERIKEVTELGLNYNLMTEYTSFVAIDSLVRAAGTTSSTVKQPLPLPLGVSNHAVGMRRISASSSGGSGMYRHRGMKTFGSAPAPEAKLVREPVMKKEARKKRPAKTTASLSQAQIRQVLDRRLSALRACHRKILPGTPGKIVVEITIGTNGRVIAVKVVSDSLKNKKLNKCILLALKRLRFPSQLQKPVTIKYPIVFK